MIFCYSSPNRLRYGGVLLYTLKHALINYHILKKNLGKYEKYKEEILSAVKLLLRPVGIIGFPKDILSGALHLQLLIKDCYPEHIRSILKTQK